jgi:hypothetical protein
MPDDKSQGIVRKRGEERQLTRTVPKHVTSVEQKKKNEDEVQETAEKSGF